MSRRRTAPIVLSLGLLAGVGSTTQAQEPSPGIDFTAFGTPGANTIFLDGMDTDDPASDNDCVVATHSRMPPPKGSPASNASVVSPVIQARPRTVGNTPPSTISTDPLNTLPTILSCLHVSPGRNLPSAARQAILALVPVPHGDRSYSRPGHSTKLRLSAAGFVDGPNSST